MVRRIMRWRPWSPSSLLNSRTFKARLMVQSVEGLMATEDTAKMAAEVAWKGPKVRLGSLRRGGVRKNLTREEEVRDSGVVVWNEEFSAECCLFKRKDGTFGSWEIVFTVFYTGLNQGPKKKTPIVGMASLNLAEFACKPEEMVISIPMLLPGAISDCNPCLHLTLSLSEMGSTLQGSSVASPVTVSPILDGAMISSGVKDVTSASRVKFTKAKLIRGFVCDANKNKACLIGEDSEGHCCSDDDLEVVYPFDTNSLSDDLDEDLENGKDDSSVRRSFNYGSLASAKYIEGSLYLDMLTSPDIDDLVYYGHQRSDSSFVTKPTSYTSEQPVSCILKRSILPWRKRKFGFLSPKNKGEPLLKKSYGEEGGDDIDFDRRQLSSDESLSLESFKGASGSVSFHFGDDNFSVGSWESKEIASRDGNMKLSTSVFFASIDQRNERAAGESACAVLVAIIADWFQANPNMMPTRSEFDNLIREGSLEWRKLCENQIYQERFPDKHFDLETVIKAKIRPITDVSDKFLVGFFTPEFTCDNNTFDFLKEVLSFDNIWDEISHTGSATGVAAPQLYIVSWNDHFFILLVENNAYYIIDTLGERLHEGCNQAYVLKFDDSTLIHRVSNDSTVVSDKVENTNGHYVEQNTERQDEKSVPELEGQSRLSDDKELVCRGKDSCKEYIKSFLTAIPIRELQVDIKKSLTSSSIHRRLQIEFHSIKLLKELTAQPVGMLSRPIGSDSEFSSLTEFDPQYSSSPESTGELLCPLKLEDEILWSPEATAATSLFEPSINFEVAVN